MAKVGRCVPTFDSRVFDDACEYAKTAGCMKVGAIGRSLAWAKSAAHPAAAAGATVQADQRRRGLAAA